MEKNLTEQVPDLNRIRHFLDELEGRLGARPDPPTSVRDLFSAVVAEWDLQPGSNIWSRA